MTPLLDLDDWALSLYADSTLLYSEPAVALETDGQLSFGRVAVAEARIHPRRVNQGYLSRLSADPLPQPFRTARNHADLFYHQLRALATTHPLLTREPVLMIVRGTTTPDQLGLVLGIAAECGIRVGGFVDRGVAALASIGGLGERLCIDFSAEHADICKARLGVDVVRHQASLLPGLGIQNIQDGWANVIADAFIQHSRFDPLHAAATEQQLYDTIRSWFEQGEVPASLAIEHQQEIRRVDIRADALEQKLQDRLEPLMSQLVPGSTVCLGPNAAAVPAFPALLRRLGVTPLEVRRNALHAYVEQHVSPLGNPDEVRFLTTLPAAQPPALAGFMPSPPIPLRPEARPSAGPGTAPVTTSAATVITLPGQPTHGLHATVAWPIGSAELPRSAVGEDARAGTTLDVGGRLFTLIEVRS